jgi:hypothetical protein
MPGIPVVVVPRCEAVPFRTSALISSRTAGSLESYDAQVFTAKGLDGALSSFLCSLCFCFVASCCWFFFLSFLPPRSPMLLPFDREPLYALRFRTSASLTAVKAAHPAPSVAGC